jgi:cytochrome c oxidase subunit 1
MTLLAPQPIVSRPGPVAAPRKGSRLSNLLRTTDHKTIGLMYLATAFAWFVVGGFMAMLMRAELARPHLQFLSPEQYNQLFTMHGTIMLLFFATPLFFAFGNLIMPLQIGSPDVAFPRLNAFSYWLYLFGAVITVSGFATPGGAAAFGWTAYAPLNSISNSPQVGGDLWDMGLVVAGIGTTKLAKANTIGVAKNSSMIVPCMVNSWLYCSGDRNCSPGRASSPRISMAMKPPITNHVNDVARYIRPIVLWSVVRSNDVNREPFSG